MNEPSGQVVRESRLKRWYSYNKQTIPLMFILVGAFFFTAFLDFEIRGTDIELESHITAIQKFLNTPYNNLSAFYLFAIYLIAIVQVFNAATFAKKRSPTGVILLTVLTVVQVAAVTLYTSIFFVEQANRNDYTIDDVARFSYTVFIVGAAFYVVGTAIAWLYVNWKYVKEID